MPLSPSDFLSFSQVCKGLPALAPRAAQARLRAALEQGEPATDIGGVVVTREELGELFRAIVRDGYSSRVVSPAGAALLARLYLAGAFHDGRVPDLPPSPELAAYTRGEGPWLEPARARAAARASYQARLDAPDAIHEREFTPRLLDDLFRRHRGRGDAQMHIGGVLVRRTVDKQLGPGRAVTFGIFFDWTAADGQPRRLCAVSQHSGIWTN